MAVFSTDLSQTVEVLLERKNYNSVKDILSTVNPADIAVIFRDQPAQRLLMLFRLLPKETAADVFVEMEPVLQEQLINAFSDKELADIVNEMYADDAADLVEEMPASVVKRILKQASPDVRRDINELLKYPEDSAGSIMTPEFADLHSSMTAAEALDHIRLTGVDKETIDICYVIEKRRLIGLVSLRTLVLANARAVVSDLMDENVISVGQTVSAAQCDGSVQKPHTVAAAFDAFSGFHTADNRKIRSCACSKHHPDIVHPDADGHGRQFRQPIVRNDYTQPFFGGDSVF